MLTATVPGEYIRLRQGLPTTQTIEGLLSEQPIPLHLQANARSPRVVGFSPQTTMRPVVAAQLGVGGRTLLRAWRSGATVPSLVAGLRFVR